MHLIYNIIKLAMCNLKSVLPLTKDSTTTRNDKTRQPLEGGVHFLCGDIFDAATMVILFKITCIIVPTKLNIVP